MTELTVSTLVELITVSLMWVSLQAIGLRAFGILSLCLGQAEYGHTSKD